MKTTTHGLCPLCNRSLKLTKRSDGASVFPRHGHTMAHGRAGKDVQATTHCPVSGYSVEGLAILADIFAAFGKVPALVASKPATVTAPPAAKPSSDWWLPRSARRFA